METWRLIAIALLAIIGGMLALIVMAKVRDHTRNSGQVAIAGAISLTVLLLLGVFMLTIFSAPVVWGVVVLITVVVGVLTLAS